MGNRVGLARIEALIENLKRELDLGGTTLNGVIRKVKTTSSATTLTNADSGTLIDATGGAYDINLPQDPKVGCTFTFTHSAATTGARNIDAYDGTHFFKGHCHDHETATPSIVTFNGSSHDQIKLASGADASHTLITITFIGSNTWLLTDSYSHDISDVSAGTASGNA